ncbi:MAG: hypothetical protein NZT92_20975, partial [Abditibacteriales bacterium]|nr:hypothetical protein [Abditibacteriales bacterium]MDW8368197.1 hypothetical protein [Abditibacteriales bacterium]
WGHFQEAKDNGNVIAFGVADFGKRGKHTLTLRGDGTMTVYYEPTSPAERRLRVFLHFIPVPLQRTAQTSPAAMMTPLVAACPAAHYRRCGLPVPAEAW